MKTLKVTKLEYDEFLYPAVASAQDPDYKSAKLTEKVLAILEKDQIAPKLNSNGLPSDGRQPWFRLTAPSAEFQLEDAHAEHILKSLEAALPTLQRWRARQMLGLIDQLKKEE